jgi:Uma2 family endonuclease
MTTVACDPANTYVCPELAGTLMTPEEFDAVTEYDEEYRYELIHGVLVALPFPDAPEACANEQLSYLLHRYGDSRSDGAAFDATLMQQYVRTATSRRLADRAIWVGLGRLPRLDQDVPAIAVEFVSRSRRDRQRDYVEKRREYMAAGVREYWIIDRFRRTMTVVRPGPAGPVDQAVAEAETYTTPLLPGFALPLAPLLVMANRWGERGA